MKKRIKECYIHFISILVALLWIVFLLIVSIKSNLSFGYIILLVLFMGTYGAAMFYVGIYESLLKLFGLYEDEKTNKKNNNPKP